MRCKIIINLKASPTSLKKATGLCRAVAKGVHRVRSPQKLEYFFNTNGKFWNANGLSTRVVKISNFVFRNEIKYLETSKCLYMLYRNQFFLFRNEKRNQNACLLT